MPSQTKIEAFIEKLGLTSVVEQAVDFNALLNEDALLDFTYTEKIVYKLLCTNENSDREIAEATGLPLSTVAWHRAQFWERAKASAIFLGLAMEMEKNMSAPRKNKRYTKGMEIPTLSAFEYGIITGFERNKFDLHMNQHKHLSVITLVAMPEKELAFFVCDAASKAFIFESDIVYPHHWETPGGHCKAMDIPDSKIGTPLPKELRSILDVTSWREATEEIYIKSTPLERNRLHYLAENQSDNPDNMELSGIYLYRYNGNTKKISSGDIRFRDEWTTPLGFLVKKQWVAKLRKYEGVGGLREEFAEHPEYFSDGLSRCLRMMEEDRSFVKKIERLLQDE